MKKHFILVFLAFTASMGKGQTINFLQDSLIAVVKQAKESNQMVFVAIMPPETSPGYKISFEALKKIPVGQFFNAHVLSFATAYGSTEASKLAAKYSIVNYPTFLYLDGNNNILYRSAGSSAYYPQRYIDDANVAYSKFTSGRTISWYQAELDKGNGTSQLLKDYIIECENMGITDNHVLIDEYVNLQLVSNFKSFDQVVFVLEAGPLVQSIADKAARLNQKVIDSIYKTLPLQRRAAINNRIIVNTRKEAILKKDEQMAMRAALFAENSYGSKDFRAAFRAYQNNMLAYYKAIKDTTKSLPLQITIMDQNYMVISADSVKKLREVVMDSARVNGQRMMAILPPHDTSSVALTSRMLSSLPHDSALAVAKRLKLTSLTDTAGMQRLHIAQTLASLPMIMADPVSTTLNNNAWDLYLSRTKNKKYLNRALAWTKRALELASSATYIDTEAHILYRLQLYDQAIETEQKAIAMTDGEKRDSSTMKNELRKMQAKTL